MSEGGARGTMSAVCESDDALLDLLRGEAVVGRVDEAVAGERVADGLHDLFGDVLVLISGDLGKVKRLESRIVDYARWPLDRAPQDGERRGYVHSLSEVGGYSQRGTSKVFPGMARVRVNQM